MAQLRQWLAVLGPNVWVQAAAIVVGSVLLGKIVDWVVCGLAGLWARRTKTDLDDRIVAMLHRPLFVSVVLIGLGTATLWLPLPDRPTWATLAVLETIAISVWLVFALRFVSVTLDAFSRRADPSSLVQARTVPLLENVGFVVLVGGAVYFFFLAWNIDVTAWLASAGIIGIALGFAAKDTLANLFAGVFILVDAPYKIGDVVVLDTGDRGRVTHIGLRSTRLLTRDDIEITIPNAIMGNSKIINESGGPSEKERVRIQVGVAYGSDVDRVRAVLLEVASGHEELCSDPEPRVRFRSFGDSGLDFELLVWIDEPGHRGLIQDALNTEVYKAFGEAGIEIPYPKRDVYVRQLPEPPER
jgi:MscS family membrane protein